MSAVTTATPRLSRRPGEARGRRRAPAPRPAAPSRGTARPGDGRPLRREPLSGAQAPGWNVVRLHPPRTCLSPVPPGGGPARPRRPPWARGRPWSSPRAPCRTWPGTPGWWCAPPARCWPDAARSSTWHAGRRRRSWRPCPGAPDWPAGSWAGRRRPVCGHAPPMSRPWPGAPGRSWWSSTTAPGSTRPRRAWSPATGTGC